MQDDYLDQYNNQLGKNRASDLANNKLTFASCMSQGELYDRISSEFQKTLNCLSCFGESDHLLYKFINSLFNRSHANKQLSVNYSM
jgi:farnesyl diphosphate synthase